MILQKRKIKKIKKPLNVNRVSINCRLPTKIKAQNRLQAVFISTYALLIYDEHRKNFFFIENK